MTIQPRKRFAQHWLLSDKALNKIIQAAELSESDRILEIGPGTGVLTHRLLPLAASVVAVEIDRDLCQKLVKKIWQSQKFFIITRRYFIPRFRNKFSTIYRFPKSS